VTRLIIEKLLLTPTERLKGLSNADTVRQYSEALGQLFDLESPRPAVERPGDAAAETEHRATPKTPVTS
jgi:hypothetical protein